MNKKSLIVAVLLFFSILFSGCIVADFVGTQQTKTPKPTSLPLGQKADFGDAPDPKYPSLLIGNGARHLDISRALFGDDVDDELDSKQINIDVYDDGLMGTSPISFVVTNKNWNGDLYVNILIDRNQDGDWENATNNGPDTNEWAVQNMKVDVPQGESRQFITKVELPEETWMRMTLTSVRLVNYFGEGEFRMGETEDYIYTKITTTIPPPTTTTTSTTTTVRIPPPTIIDTVRITTTTSTTSTTTTTLKEISCWGNLQEVDKTDINTFDSKTMVCKEDCPQGYRCATSSCTCVRETTTTTSTSTTTTATLSCEDRGGFSTQSACNAGCQKPDFCEVDEGSNCWVCVQVSCQPPLTESQNCDNQCGAGQACQEFQGTGCYQCVCQADLEVASLSTSIGLSASTTCAEGACTTECTLDATSQIRVRNVGSGSVGSSSASVEITSGVGTVSAGVGGLGPGQTSGTLTIKHSKSAVVQGSTCTGLPWWSQTYTITAKADSANAIVECNEGNNALSTTASPQ